MKTFIDVGFYHPSNANWSYRIFIVLDETGADLFTSQFGGDYRAIEQLKKQGEEVKRFSTPFNAEYKWKDVKLMKDIETLGKEAVK